jgi:hypothetical protein
MRIRTAPKAPLSLAAIVGVLVLAASAHAVVTIDVGSVAGTPGSTVTFGVTLHTTGEQVGGTLNRIAFDAATPIATYNISPVLAGLSDCSWLPQHCTRLVDCQQVSCLIAPDISPIPDGSILYTCDVKIAANAAAGSYPLVCSGWSASDPTGKPLQAQCSNGQIQVGCPGDCDGDGTVTVQEVVKGTNIALGGSSLDDCRAVDYDHDAKVTIDEILQAVDAALNGCAGIH